MIKIRFFQLKIFKKLAILVLSLFASPLFADLSKQLEDTLNVSTPGTLSQEALKGAYASSKVIQLLYTNNVSQKTVEDKKRVIETFCDGFETSLVLNKETFKRVYSIKLLQLNGNDPISKFFTFVINTETFNGQNPNTAISDCVDKCIEKLNLVLTNGKCVIGQQIPAPAIQQQQSKILKFIKEHKKLLIAGGVLLIACLIAGSYVLLSYTSSGLAYSTVAETSNIATLLPSASNAVMIQSSASTALVAVKAPVLPTCVTTAQAVVKDVLMPAAESHGFFGYSLFTPGRWVVRQISNIVSNLL